MLQSDYGKTPLTRPNITYLFTYGTRVLRVYHIIISLVDKLIRAIFIVTLIHHLQHCLSHYCQVYSERDG